jgi:hypothetical protein
VPLLALSVAVIGGAFGAVVRGRRHETELTG